MQDDENPVLTALKRIPWNKGKLTGASLRSDQSMSGQFAPNSKSRDELVTWRCSTSPSTVSCGAAMSLL